MTTYSANLPEQPETKLRFRDELHLQRWDDHRYYHQSRINQSLHFVSSICFLTAYVTVFVSPGVAALIGWLLAMCSRQAGHFFFEPRDYDDINKATHHHKEAIKVGYNLHRKRVLHGIWVATPVLLWLNPSAFGVVTPARSFNGYVNNVAILWLYLGVAALLFRTVQLFFVRNVQTGLVWATKILTDPFHDFKTYAKAPLALMRGERLDPMDHVRQDVAAEYMEEQALEAGHATS